MLDNVHLNGFVCGTIAGSQFLPGNHFAVGKSMMFRLSVLDSLGGLESVANVQAEDYILCKMFQTAGYEVRVSSGPVRNVNVRNTVKRFINRYHRWAIMRSRACPHVFAGEPFINPMALALVALLVNNHARWPLAWAVGLTMARDGLHWYRLRGWKGLSQALVLGIFKDIMLLAVWVVTPFTNVVVWRGHRFRVGIGSRLYAETPMVMSELVPNEE
jgi:ceramide glucosyltransferase